MDRKLHALEDASRRLAATDFAAPRLYSSLLLENQAVPVRNATSVERNLFVTNGSDPIWNIKITEGGPHEFEETFELATALNEICQNHTVEPHLQRIGAAHGEVLLAIANLETKLKQLQESNSAAGVQEVANAENGEIMEDIIREEGEIFALEQMMNEKRQTLSQMQKELDALSDYPETEDMDEDEDSEASKENDPKRMEIELLQEQISQQKRQEKEQIAIYESLLKESNELVSAQQEEEQEDEEISSPAFDDLIHLYNTAKEQKGDTFIEPKGVKGSYLKLERLLDGLERAHRHVVALDILLQLRSYIIGSCADPSLPEFDPPRTDMVSLMARTLQLVIQARGEIALPDLKDLIREEALARGVAESLGLETVYALVAGNLIQMDRTTKPNMVRLT